MMIDKGLFKKPDKEVLDLKQIFETNKRSTSSLYCYSLFLVATKVNKDNKIEVDKESFMELCVAPFVKTEGVFSQRAHGFMNMAKSLYQATSSLGYDGILMGYYNHFSTEIVSEVYIEDFYKLNSLDIVDYYFTFKTKELKFDKMLFEQEFLEVVNSITRGSSINVSTKDFLNFKNNLIQFVNSGRADRGQTFPRVSEGIVDILKQSFPRVTSPMEQLKISKLLEQIDCLSCKITKDRKKLLPFKEDYPTEPCEVVFLPNERFLKIFKHN